MANDPIDEAFVEIKPDLKNFDREVKQGLDKSFDRIEDKLDDVVDVIERQFNRLIDTLHLHFESLEDKADRSFEQIEDSARSAGRKIATDIEVGTKIAKHEIDDLADNAHHDFNRIERDARGSGFSIGKMFSSIGSAVGSLVSTVGNIGKSIGEFGSTAGSALSSVGSTLGSIGGGVASVGQIAAYAILIPVVVGLVGALIQLSGALFALPAAAGVAAAVIAPLIIGFKGVGEAIGAGLSGDVEKFNEALKGLAPNAQKVVKEFVGLGPALKQIKQVTQNALFGPLIGAIAPLGRTLLPLVSSGFQAVAASLGKVIAGFLELLADNDIVEDIGDVFESTVNIINRFGPSIISLFGVFFGIMEKGLPWVEKLFGAFADGIDATTAWLSSIQQNGQLTGWLEKAWVVGKELWEVLKQLGIFAITLFGSFGDESTDTLTGMADALKKVNEYLKSTEGAETLHNLGVIIHWAGNALVFLIAATVGAYQKLNLFFTLIRGIGPLLSSIGNWFKNTWNNIVDWTVNAWHSITGAVSDGWNAVISFFKNTWTSIKTFFVNGWNSITSTISTFITNVKTTIMAFPGVLKQFISDAVHNLAYNVGYAIGTIIKFFIELPGKIWAGLVAFKDMIVAGWNAVVAFITETVPALAVNVAHWIADMWTKAWNATTSFVSSIITWIGELPGKIGGFVSDLYTRVVNKFTELKDTAVQKVKDLVTSAKEEAAKLPGQVESALKSVIDKAKDIGHDMIMGMVNGIKDAAHYLWDAARDAVMDALQGAKDALHSKSPSKKWAELGRDSVLGYAQGFDAFDLTKAIGSSIKMPLDKFSQQAQQSPTVNNSVSVGGAQLVAYLQIGDDQLHPVVVKTIRDNAQEVALSAQQGGTELARRR